MNPIEVSIEEMYAGTRASYDEFLAALDESLGPRPPDVLYEKFGELGPTSESVVLDAGCRHAVQACELSRRYGCRVFGIDLVDDNLREAQRNIVKADMHQLVRVSRGDLHRIPFENAMFDYIWCRDVLAHMRDLTAAFRSCRRVLKPGGKMLIYAMFGTDLLTEEEARDLCPPLATVRDNMRRSYFDESLSAAGFSVLEADELRSEWREYGEESDSKITSKQLLRIARMRRSRDRLIAAYGEKDYASER